MPKVLPKLNNHFAAPLNSEEILIFGGEKESEEKVRVFDTRTDKCSSGVIPTGAFDFINNDLGN